VFDNTASTPLTSGVGKQKEEKMFTMEVTLSLWQRPNISRNQGYYRFALPLSFPFGIYVVSCSLIRLADWAIRSPEKQFFIVCYLQILGEALARALNKPAPPNHILHTKNDPEIS